MRSSLFFGLTFMLIGSLFAQRSPDHIYMREIQTVKLYQENNQGSPPIIKLNSSDQLELHFDDISGNPKNYYYTYQLCNADWSPAEVNAFDYLKGFTQNRLNQYRMSTIATTKYVHYQVLLPERNCMPSKSGNYILKVFLDSDTSKPAFTKRMMVVDNRVNIAARVLQPFDPELMHTHQKIQFSVNTQQLNVMSPQQVKAVILQNYRWDNAITNIQPTFIRGAVMEYNGEQDCLFPAGKEYRWADLQSFRFASDRIERIDQLKQPVDIYIKPDAERNNARYLFYKDRNGWSEIGATDLINPWWQCDYAYVHFTFAPANNQPYPGKSVYLLGELTGNQVGDTSRMVYDATKGVYTKTMYLKQGYYSYMYVTGIDKSPSARLDPSLTEGNYWETENSYTILFYYRSFSGRYDELMGITTVGSRNLTSGF